MVPTSQQKPFLASFTRSMNLFVHSHSFTLSLFKQFNIWIYGKLINVMSPPSKNSKMVENNQFLLLYSQFLTGCLPYNSFIKFKNLGWIGKLGLTYMHMLGEAH